MNITQCSQSKTAFQTVTSEGARYHNLGFVTDNYRQQFYFNQSEYISFLPRFKQDGMKRESYIEVLINNVLREIKEQRSNHVRNKLKLPKGGLKNAGFIHRRLFS